jgi:glycosyltransferase involved in cell wall biosynthesis
MKVSVCVTVLNEEKTIGRLLQALLGQTKKPDEIVVVDGGSRDRTVGIIRHYQKKDKRIKLLIEECSIARGRNLSISLAKNDVVALTDAGCEPYRDWLEKLVYFFKHENVDVVAGFYDMKAVSPKNKVFNCYLGVPSKKYDAINFLPSTRSVAFRKEVWEKVGGFNEKLAGAGEDSLFFYNCVKSGVKIVREKEARVVWQEISNLTFRDFLKKIWRYSEGDARSGIWWHPSKNLASHNIKIILIYLRYILGLVLFIYSVYNPPLFYFLSFLFVFYLFWPIFKWKDVLVKWDERIWLPIVQIGSDFAVMAGFASGLTKK